MSRFDIPVGAPLFILPHADDEVLGCGAAILAHAQRGDRISLLTVFDGALGNTAGQRDQELIARREAELISSLEVLAPRSELARWSWNLPEGHVPPERDFLWAEQRLVRLMVQEPINVIYAPWSGDAHPDHRVVAELARRALAGMGHGAPALRTFEVWSSMPSGIAMPIDSDAWGTLRDALACHKSQWDEGRLLERFSARSMARAPEGCFHGQVYGRTLDMAREAKRKGGQAA
jgi:LmbE family N-acetylglucosaminyl deacetylase